MLKPSVIVNISLFLYFATFLILLKIRSFKIFRTWFVPFCAFYFGLMFATLFAVFLNGTDSTLSHQDTIFTVLFDIVFLKGKRGRVLFGGYFGIIFGILLTNFIFKCKSLSDFLDISSISFSLFLAIHRIACFVGGCCYGRPSDTFGVSFSRFSDAYTNLKGTDMVIDKMTVPLLPTQLISAFGNFAIFLFLLILFCKNKTRYPYFYFFAQALLYGIGRFIIEFFRIDPREFWGPLSMSQWISIVLVVTALVFFIKNRKEIAESFKNPSRNCRDVS